MDEQSGQEPADQAANRAGEGERRVSTTFNRPWLIRVVIMFVVLFAFGTWGLYDALVAYPNRGEAYAEYAEWQYLQAAQEADEEDPAIFPGGVGVANPEQELEELTQRETQQRNQSDAANSESSRHRRAQMEIAREKWLTALNRVGELEPERTDLERDAVRDRLEQLGTEWTTKSPPSPLAGYDIPSQWVIAAVCYGFSAYILFLFIRVAAVNYRWDPSEKRLMLPGGASITPADITDVDKRKWDKFVVFVHVRPEHPQLGGKVLRFDTFRHARLEDWILEMEAEAFPERAEQASTAEETPAEPEGTPIATPEREGPEKA